MLTVVFGRIEIVKPSFYVEKRPAPRPAPASPIAAPSRVECLASACGHLHDAARGARLPLAAGGRHEPLRVRSDGGAVPSAGPQPAAQRPGHSVQRLVISTVARDLTTGGTRLGTAEKR